MNGTILLPVAGRSSRFPGTRPKWMLVAPGGELMLERALSTVPDRRGRRVVIGALQEHLDAYDGRDLICRALGPEAEIVVFPEVTRGPAITVSEMIRRARVEGSFFVKDCDSWFVTTANVFENTICAADLRDAPDVRNVAGKSFLRINENGLVDHIAEKHVCSPHISVGGYGFASAAAYQEACVKVEKDSAGEPFISHVILQMLQMGHVFKADFVSRYEDVGTLKAWNDFRERSALYIVDIDGVVFRNAGEFRAPFWTDQDVPLSDNVAALRRLADDGAALVFVTSRPERHRAKTEAALYAAGLRWSAAIFGVPHSRRYLVNDFAPSNPYPSAVAINLVRDADDLAAHLGAKAH